MEVNSFSFGRIEIDGKSFEKDIVISKASIEKRQKKSSKHLKQSFGHTPLTLEENIPWDCRVLVVGTGIYGMLPVLDEVKIKADDLGVSLITEKTQDAVKHINEKYTNFILHLTC
jgi:hypothetical protein